MIAIDLFDRQKNIAKMRNAPLAHRMRPRKLNEVLGQSHLTGEGKPLYLMCRKKRLFSVIFWGPPGTGKTTLARLTASAVKAEFFTLSAVASGVADLRKVIARAEDNLAAGGRRTVLFIDEIHRYNKSQQSLLLPNVEDGTITLIGATTENPAFEVIGPLLSRMRIFRTKALDEADLRNLLKKALTDNENGLGAFTVQADKAFIKAVVDRSAGDARQALNCLETAAQLNADYGQGKIHLTIEDFDNSSGIDRPLYDKGGAEHYQTASAFIKSIRGSDPDAALFWMAKMIKGGEDPNFIMRRLVIAAAEDIGNADPTALILASAAARAVEFVGLPEAEIIMAQAVTYAACAPKSNSSIVAVMKAMQDVQNESNPLEVPDHLKGGYTKLDKNQGWGINYKYPHDFDHAFIEQHYFPDGMTPRKYYEPSDSGHEAGFKRKLEKNWKNRKRASND